jgi:5-(carboxyamino)imidazole ribonucleotide synthase
MVNIIGHMPPRAELLAVAGAHLHDYGKRARPGRKLGHVTIVESSARTRDAAARVLLAKLAAGVRIP